eukprot:1148902-Pelagomonas_calceolata.AAC.2
MSLIQDSKAIFESSNGGMQKFMNLEGSFHHENTTSCPRAEKGRVCLRACVCARLHTCECVYVRTHLQVNFFCPVQITAKLGLRVQRNTIFKKCNAMQIGTDVHRKVHICVCVCKGGRAS